MAVAALLAVAGGDLTRARPSPAVAIPAVTAMPPADAGSAATAIVQAGTSGLPAFRGRASPLPPRLRQRMRGSSWHRRCPVHLRDLALLTMTFRGFDRQAHRGRMVVASSIADDVLEAFRRSYEGRFPIRRMRLVDAYAASDTRSMAANNTSAFNCRKVAGTSRWSEHSYGTAVDINPVQNPYVRGSTVQPPAGERFLDRSRRRQGMIVRPSPVIRAFRRIGWAWGGDWRTLKDYQHFSASGR